MAKKYTIEEIKGIIEKEGCELLTKVYKDNKSKILIRCSCGEEFITTFANFNKGKKQCDKCTWLKNGSRVKFNCDYCGKESIKEKSSFEGREHHFCSKECKDKWQKTSLLGENNPNFGNHHTEEAKKKISEAKIGKYVGEKSPRYNHNLTDEERKIKRRYPEYDDFIEAVYERDNYTCQCCGDNRGGNLNAHHLNGYNWDKENRTNPNNGITLCEKCHKEYHSVYGYGDNTVEQFREFLFNKYLQNNNLKFLALIETIDLTTRAF